LITVFAVHPTIHAHSQANAHREKSSGQRWFGILSDLVKFGLFNFKDIFVIYQFSLSVLKMLRREYLFHRCI